MRKLSQLIVAALIAMATCVSTHAAEWRQFRGPDGQGHADAKNLPATWSETENEAGLRRSSRTSPFG